MNPATHVAVVLVLLCAGPAFAAAAADDDDYEYPEYADSEQMSLNISELYGKEEVKHVGKNETKYADSEQMPLNISELYGKEEVKHVGKNKTKQVCYDRVGCFSMEYPWTSFLRPIPAPDTPKNIGTKFYLFTRKQPKRTVIPIVPDVILDDVDYNSSLSTIFITHGFMADGNSPWMNKMKDVLLKKHDAQVILTDWGPGAAGPLKYMQVVANTRVVAAEAVRLIRHMMDKHDAVPPNIYLIGHSLGAQISAYIGKAVKNIARLSALDPAQPAFEGFDREVRLDSSDAMFVEVVHTDARPTIPVIGLGMMGRFGDVDYYINGGYMQPGCFITENVPSLKSLDAFLKLPVSVIENIVTCPHGRSTEIFIEAIRSDNCTFWGHPGTIVDSLIGIVSLGYLSKYFIPSQEDCTVKTCSPLKFDNYKYPARGAFTIATTSSAPFCIPEKNVDGLMLSAVDDIYTALNEGVLGLAGQIGHVGHSIFSHLG